MGSMSEQTEAKERIRTALRAQIEAHLSSANASRG